jgi:hypothetical protein
MKFGCAIHSNSPTVVMFLNGTKYKVEVDVTYDDYCAMPVDAVVKIERTDEALNLSGKHNDYYKFGGYPIFIQTPREPIGENGKPYTYICTIQNNWGDMGNANIFALISDCGDKIEDVYVEASCS